MRAIMAKAIQANRCNRPEPMGRGFKIV